MLNSHDLEAFMGIDEALNKSAERKAQEAQRGAAESCNDEDDCDADEVGEDEDE
jgi:hypothetical protein